MPRIMGQLPIMVLLFLATTTFGSYNCVAGDSQKKDRTRKTGWIGIVVQDLNEKIAREAKLNSEEGAYVKEVLENSPADSAGIKEKDVIIELNRKKVFDSDDLVKIIRKTEPGTKVNLTVIRDGEKKTIEATVGKKKELRRDRHHMMPPMPDVNFCVDNRILGLHLLTLNEQLGEYFGAPSNEGVLITEVEKESTADKAGFKAGDIITRIGKRTIDRVDKVQRELEKYDEGDKVDFEILRKGAKKVLNVEIEEDQSIQQNFFFRTPPHIQRFHFNPFEDTEMNLQLDNLQPKLDQAERKLEGTMKNLEDKWGNFQNHVLQFTPLQLECISL
jgi:C-terminal processing protease CtpA/Prc